jgi:hypothetical protein
MVSVILFGGHFVHDDAEPMEYVPIGHGTHDDPESYVPGGQIHILFDVDRGAIVVYPLGQLVHPV